MSLERAYKNCRICYSIGSKIDSLDDAGEATMVPMNEAMKALEDARLYAYRLGFNERKIESKIADDALQACARCEFKCAGIVEVLEKALPDQFNPEGLI